MMWKHGVIGVGLLILMTSTARTQTIPIEEDINALGDILNTLTTERTAKEIAIADYQRAAILLLQRRLESQLLLAMELDLPTGAPMPSGLAQTTYQIATDLDDLLLPVQKTWLFRSRIENEVRSRKLDNRLSSNLLARYLGLTDEQKKKLEEKAEQLNEASAPRTTELEERIKELEKEVQDIKDRNAAELLESLTDEQQQKFRALFR